MSLLSPTMPSLIWPITGSHSAMAPRRISIATEFAGMLARRYVVAQSRDLMWIFNGDLVFLWGGVQRNFHPSGTAIFGFALLPLGAVHPIFPFHGSQSKVQVPSGEVQVLGNRRSTRSGSAAGGTSGIAGHSGGVPMRSICRRSQASGVSGAATQ